MRYGWFVFAVLLAGFVPAASCAQDAPNTAAIAARAKDIYSDPLSPGFGNPNGDVTIVEFYDYQCGYCKLSEPGLERILQEDKNLKVIYKDFPKLGPLSVMASRITLAALRQSVEKYFMLHNLLMKQNGRLRDEEMIYQDAASVGLDVDRLKKDMNDDAIATQIQNSIALGKSVGVRVTPSFIVGKHFYPGYATYEQLKQFVDYERASGQGR